jgi:outer membrane protein assembly factor BamB
MKKLLFTVFIIALNLNLFGQELFKPEATIKFPFTPDSKSINEDRTKVLCWDDEQIAMIDLNTGNSLWTVKIKDKFNIKKIDYCSWEDNNRMTLGYKEKKELKTILISELNGEPVEQAKTIVIKKDTTAYNWRNRFSNTRFYSKEHDASILLSYTEKLIGSSAYSGSLKVNLNCSGKYNWAQTIDTKVVRSLCSNAGFGLKLGDLITTYVMENKVFLVYDGFTVLDITTGNILWQSGFDFVNFDFGLLKCTQEFPKAPFPYLKNNLVYVTDLHKEVLKLQALDINTGKPVWESEKFDKNTIISDIHFIDNLLIEQMGGKVISQLYKPGTGGAPDVCNTQYSFPSDGGFKAFDAISGKLIWSTVDKKEFAGISKRSTNSIRSGNNIFVASEKELIVIDGLSGKIGFTSPLSKLKIGKPEEISFYKENILIQASEGFAMFSIDGKLIYNTPTDEIFNIDYIDNILVVWIGSSKYDLDQFICFNPENGKILGKMKSTYHPYFSPTGNYFIKFSKKEFEKYKVF